MDLDRLRSLMELMREQGAHYLKAGDVEIHLVPQPIDTGDAVTGGHEPSRVPPHFDPALYSDGVVPGMSIDQARTVVDS